ncbi:toll/interleukin-1 receptor domain-containing protein [Catellatospora tritici]|nr:toll/interleukin-1 receptor domain-containing protein [Catellatospora tritici]MBV1849964.1 toll/interleukin-1 receptor domain-containing protein [Catellatospora tritici]
MPGYVFISYHHGSNTAYAEKLARFLTEHGVEVWFDREIVSGALVPPP